MLDAIRVTDSLEYCTTCPVLTRELEYCNIIILTSSRVLLVLRGDTRL
jgi:hypothetical protein